MPQKPLSARQPPSPAAEHHRPAGRNPRNVPHRRLDSTPPQPDAPEESEIDKQQDQQPVDPVPLIHEAPNPYRGTRERRNG